MKRLSAAMLLLLLSVMFTIGGSLAYDNAFYGSQTRQINKRYASTAMASPNMLSVDFDVETSDSSDITVDPTKEYPFETTQYWEPGHVDVSVLKLSSSKNVSYQVYISRVTKNDNLVDQNVVLSDVIDVYCFSGDASGLSRNEVTAADNFKGELYELLNVSSEVGSEIYSGNLNAASEQHITIALKIQENAGNMYQGKTVCRDGIKITVKATEITTTNP